MSGNQQIVGWGDEDDGFYIGVNNGSFGIMRLRNQIEDWVYQDDFNIDKIDGTGDSGYNIDITKGNVYQIQIQWLGFGTIKFSTETPGGIQLPFHSINFPNNYTETSILNPSLPVRYFIKNTTNAGNVLMKFGSCAVMNEGRIELKGYGYYTSNTNLSVGTTEVLIVSIRNKIYFNGRKNKNISLIRFIEGANDHSQQGNIYIYINSTITGTSYVDNDGNNSIIEIDTQGTITTYGRLIGGALLGKTEAKSVYLDRIILNPGDVITITAKESAGANGIITGSISWIEDIL